MVQKFNSRRVSLKPKLRLRIIGLLRVSKRIHIYIYIYVCMYDTQKHSPTLIRTHTHTHTMWPSAASQLFVGRGVGGLCIFII